MAGGKRALDGINRPLARLNCKPIQGRSAARTSKGIKPSSSANLPSYSTVRETGVFSSSISILKGKGNAFLLGDAGYPHLVGGQGMNTGIGDAVNLAWKLRDVIKGKANKNLLDTYEVERIAFARELVSSTEQLCLQNRGS